jgi:error-prone DNA polymerase
MIQADKDDVELLGYLKLDILGVRMLSSMRHALDEIARTTGEKVDLDRIALDDEPTFELIRRSDTLGCFQIESPGQRELLQKLQPTRWEDLIVDISLFRPGPVKSDMISPYLRRRQGMERPTYIHPGLRGPLQETFGVIVFHEQVIRTLAALAGYTETYADHIRRHLDDPEMVPGFERAFVDRAVERGVDRGAAEATWHAVAQFASFGFCKAHAAAFAVPTYQSAWLKAHYPAHLISGLLTHDPGMYPRRLILEDARQHGIEIFPLDVNRSEPDYVVERAGGLKERAPASVASRGEHFGIRLALKDVHGISDAEIRSIMMARAERAFRDVEDFMTRATVSRPVTEALAHAGAFDALEPERRRHLYAAMTAEVVREGDQMRLLDATVPQHEFKDYSDAEVVRAELEVLGMDASRHIVSFFEPLLADLGVTRTRDLRRVRGGTRVMVAGVKVASQTPAIRSGQRIIFLTLDDATGPVEVTVFESVQPRVAKTVFHGYALAVVGELRRTGVGGVSVVADDVWDLSALHHARADGRLREALQLHDGGPRAGPGAGSGPRTLWHASPGSAG